MFTEDLDAFLSTDEFAVPVIMGTVETSGIENEADERLLGDQGRGEVLGSAHTIAVQTALLRASGLQDQDPITVDGTVYRAGVGEAIEDGAFSVIPLGDVT